LKDKFESSEEVLLEQYLERWEAEVEKEFPSRRISTLVVDTTGKSICVTRFFKQISPPGKHLKLFTLTFLFYTYLLGKTIQLESWQSPTLL
jgi:hypothetical protein